MQSEIGASSPGQMQIVTVHSGQRGEHELDFNIMHAISRAPLCETQLHSPKRWPCSGSFLSSNLQKNNKIEQPWTIHKRRKQRHRRHRWQEHPLLASPRTLSLSRKLERKWPTSASFIRAFPGFGKGHLLQHNIPSCSNAVSTVLLQKCPGQHVTL